MARLLLPSNATSIRDTIDTSFSCNSRPYGYYADLENECQIFHICFPVGLLRDDSSTSTQMFMWSFICPPETVFNQEKFTCMRTEDSIPCRESASFYSLNRNFGRSDFIALSDEPIEDEEEQQEIVVATEETEEAAHLLQSPLEVDNSVDNQHPEERTIYQKQPAIVMRRRNSRR
ncbi:hypothetical protein AAG570_000493 [Ranatra chinensis]|uniref:Chitin-binding type-2 domain-containing protein n=1 Tax=Ranatra chinensis TaxID=642074 RepID=A0ABD0ZE41_9HEMI